MYWFYYFASTLYWLTNQIISSNLRYTLFWTCPYKCALIWNQYKKVTLEWDPISHLRNPLQYEVNHFKVNSKLLSIILNSFTNVYIYFTILTRNEYVIEYYSNIEFLKMFESSDGKHRAQALPSRLFTNSLPLTTISQSKLELSERCWQSEALPLPKQRSNETKIVILYDQYTCRHIAKKKLKILKLYITEWSHKSNNKGFINMHCTIWHYRYTFQHYIPIQAQPWIPKCCHLVLGLMTSLYWDLML